MATVTEMLRCARCALGPGVDEYGRIEPFLEVIVSEPREMVPGSGFTTPAGRVLHYRIHSGCFDARTMARISR